jgi:3-deoxy-D-arabino-heptulosonate 7-phosphate (DAHP) synthase
MAGYAQVKGWSLGIKNGKWYGDAEATVEGVPLTNMEKTWYGHLSFAESENLPKEKVSFIQRGIDITQKGNYRYAPSHKSAARIKKLTGCEMLFDPSHSFGKLMRDEIVSRTIEAMKLKTEDGYLYDGIMIEVGTSPTDTDQHITIDEFKALCKSLSTRTQPVK